MLRDIWGRDVTKIGRGQDFKQRVALLPRDVQQAIRSALRAELDGVAPGKATAASWIPGRDWTGSVYEPIYTTACQRDFDSSAMLFGQMFREVVIEHPAWWTTVKQPKRKGDPSSIEIALYWREG